MRRKGKILIALMLSLMIIYLGAGISIITCTHMNTVKVAQISEMTQSHNCCNEQSPCMHISVVKLSPTSIVQQASFHFDNAFYVVPLFGDLIAYWLQPQFVTHITQHIYHAFFSLPRQYLSLIRILII